MATAQVRASNRRIEISHADKVLFAGAGLTKLDLARHYERVAGLLVRQIRDHPLAMQAFPGGIDRGGYFAKNVPDHFPEWIRRATLAKRGGTVTHVLANDAATLVYLAGQNVVTLHAWPSRADRPNEPDRVIFDLDPPDGVFAEVRAAARTLGDLLRDAGLAPYAMTTGSRGLHVVAPLRRTRGVRRRSCLRPRHRDTARRSCARVADDRAAQNQTRRADLHRHRAQRARGRRVRRATAAAGACGHAAALGGARRSSPAS